MSVFEALNHLGSVVSINGSIMMVLGDAGIAATWKGVTNAVNDEDLEAGGSDWARCLDALNWGTDLPFARVTCDGGELLTIRIHVSGGGYVEVFGVGEALVLIEACWSDVEHLADRDFLDYVKRPCSADATDAGLVEVTAGAIALLPAPSSGERVPEALANLGPAGSAQFATESEWAMVVELPTRRYRVRIEDQVEGPWGLGARAIVEPEPAVQG
ncbi:hypothetical protein OG741_37380 [Streptomyces sp. NBC_01410]|uniref:hypothetical protein n=1 Tax=Streptomyces sp. NBC_01410 TaxID=2903856 RepID=UPI0032474967